MTSVKDQTLQCESCWAFATLGAIEAIINIEANNPDLDVDLSEQYLISCSDPSAGNCTNGYPPVALLYIKSNGIPDEECFPYQASAAIPCSAKCTDWQDRRWKIENFKVVTPNTTSAYQSALQTYGP